MRILNTSLCALAMAAGTTVGSTGSSADSFRINEVVHNPSGSDDTWEYVEIFGCPNTPLTGLALLVINNDPNATPSPTNEIDEAFWFPTCGTRFQTNDEGYFVIWNTANTSGDVDEDADDSDIYSVLPDSITREALFGGGDIAEQILRHEASYRELESTGDTAGNISNDGSNTFVLLACVTDYSIIEKDDSPPLDGMGNPSYPGCVLDEIAYSDNGGSEYAVCEANEFDYTPGFNPGCFLRVDDIRDCVVDSSCTVDGMMGSEEYRDAYSNFFMGEVDSNPTAGVEGSTFAMESPDNFGAVFYDPGVSCDGHEDLGGVVLTPGYANATVDMGDGKQQISVSCPVSGATSESEASADINGDGVVDFQDVRHAMIHGTDNRTIIDIMKLIDK